MKRILAAALLAAALFAPAPAMADPITAALISIGVPSLLASVATLGTTSRTSFVVLADHPQEGEAMTALNLRIYDHVGYVLTDGAAYSADGLATLTGLVNKVCVAPDLGSAIACSGEVALPEAFAAAFRRAGCTSFDECEAAFSTVAAELQGRVVAMFPDRAHLFKFRAALVGWSASSGRVKALLMANYPEMTSPTRMRPALEADEVKSFEAPKCGGFVTMLTPENVEEHGVELMNRQRRTAVEMEGFGTSRAHTVGGFAQLTTISKDGIETRVLHRWADKIGEPINPAAR